MKEWSRAWVSSKQPKKQRKYRHKAPLHVRHRFVSAHLSPDLRRQFERRSLPIRKGDEVIVRSGKLKGLRGAITSVDLSKCRVRVEGANIKKVDGSEVARSLEPSNMMITKLNLDDKKRRMALDKGQKKHVKEKNLAKPEKTETKSEPKETKEIKKEVKKETKEIKKETKEVKTTKK